MTVKRMDNVGIVVEDIDAAIEFFTELGLELEGRAPIEGGHRRYARPARQTRRGARRRSGPVRRHVSALLHPGPRRNSHRACPRARAADFPMSTWDRYRPDRGAYSRWLVAV